MSEEACSVQSAFRGKQQGRKQEMKGKRHENSGFIDSVDVSMNYNKEDSLCASFQDDLSRLFKAAIKQFQVECVYVHRRRLTTWASLSFYM